MNILLMNLGLGGRKTFYFLKRVPWAGLNHLFFLSFGNNMKQYQIKISR